MIRKICNRNSFFGFGYQAGVGSRVHSLPSGSQRNFDGHKKAIECRKDAQFRIVWLTKIPSNCSPAAPQQSGGEFSEMRIASSTTLHFTATLSQKHRPPRRFFCRQN
ncbi:MAG: hypothetical protein H7835_17720, partial [Magnetococcus sp. XQGC-1]